MHEVVQESRSLGRVVPPGLELGEFLPHGRLRHHLPQCGQDVPGLRRQDPHKQELQTRVHDVQAANLKALSLRRRHLPVRLGVCRVPTVQYVQTDAVVVLQQPHALLPDLRTERPHELVVLAHRHVWKGVLVCSVPQVRVGETVSVGDQLHLAPPRLPRRPLLIGLVGRTRCAGLCLAWNVEGPEGLRVHEAERAAAELAVVPGAQRQRVEAAGLHVADHLADVPRGIEVVVVELHDVPAARQVDPHVPLQADAQIAPVRDVRDTRPLAPRLRRQAV
mmetsp:Transcript_53283/g.158932  ORF Transcript_53283/g.158932 Transcript_53283/m.158932 type:complete len:277 (-) Transcript_53283:682-1512(-)